MNPSPNDLPIDLDLIAHELSQPLTAAQGSLAVVMRRSEEEKLDPADRDLLMRIVARNLDQLAALIGSLNLFNQADQGNLELVLEAVSVQELFEDCAEDFPTERTQHHLKIDCPAGLQIQVDVPLFKQVITNLVANAIKFSPKGSTVTLSARGGGEDVVITVKDEGTGFPVRDNERIFEKAVRLDRGARGLGLGLYVARAIVDAHKGHVTATSREGEGAILELSIPA
jgi:signal transduction histidine kinase